MTLTNRIAAMCVDANGNVSGIASRTLVYVVNSPLALEIPPGGGTVAPSWSGGVLQIGNFYTVEAKPLAGFLFSHWTVGSNEVSSARLTFEMKSNLVLRPNFIANPFISAKGTYNGLYYPGDFLHEESGFLNAMTTERGTFTANLQLAGKRHTVAGKFDLAGNATNTLLRPGTNALTVELHLDFAPGVNRITGRVTDGTWSAPLTANRTWFNAATNPATAYAGKYTLIIPGNGDGTASPAGAGYGTAVIDAGGNVKLSGLLADGTPITQRVPLSKDGQFPLYVSLAKGKGSVFTWAAFANRPTDDFHGTVNWTKPSNSAAKYYPAGFRKPAGFVGARYVPPIGKTNRVINMTDGIVSFGYGNLNPSFGNSVNLAANNKVTNLSSNRLALTISLKNGLFQGTVAPPGATKSIPFKGALLQKVDAGFGYFLGTNQNGYVNLQKTP